MWLGAMIDGVNAGNAQISINIGPVGLGDQATEDKVTPNFEASLFPRKKFLFLTLLLPMLLAYATAGEAANHYIRDGGTASTSGTGSCNSGGSGNWNTANACDQLPATLVRGDTYYVADGSYSGKTFSTSTSGTTLITVKKATASDHGTETGWSSTYGDGTATFTSTLQFTTGYWLIDGVTGGGPTNWTGPFGFAITASGDMVNFGGGNVTVRHIEFRGVGSYNSTQTGVRAWSGGGPYTLSYWYMHDLGFIPFLSGANGMTVEYGYLKNWYSGASHSEICSCSSYFGGGNIGTHVFRYNLITDVQSTGGIMWDNAGNHAAELQVYGNVFYKDPAVPMNNAANGVIGGWTGGNGEDFYNARVINNTFINIPGAQILSTFPIRSGNNQASNNLFVTISTPGGGTTWQTISYNHFISTSPIGTNASTSSNSPFVNLTSLDFRLNQPTPAGTVLSAPYDVDMFGKKRGSDGVWDRGAVELGSGSGGDQTPPATPTNLRIQ